MMVRFTRKSIIVQLLAVLLVLAGLHLYLSGNGDPAPSQALDSNAFPVGRSADASDPYSTDSYKPETYEDTKTDRMLPTIADDTDNEVETNEPESLNGETITKDEEYEYIHQDDDDPHKTEFDMEYRINKPAIEEVVKKRMERIKDVCRRLNYPNSNQYNTYNMPQYSVTWCPTFKASSSTWRDFFIDTVMRPGANFMGVHYHLGVLGDKVLTRTKLSSGTSSAKGRKRVFRGEQDTSVRFTVVRHPFSRIISHQRKAMNYPHEIEAQRGHWVEDAVMDGRTDPKWSSTTKAKYRQEYDTYVKEIKGSGSHKSFSANNPYLHPPYPTVPELVDFIMKHRDRDDRGRNGHWRPTIEWCDICQNDFDIIIQLEEEPMELLYLLESTNMWKHRQHFLGKHNSSGDKSAGKQEIEEYKAQLNQKQIDYLNKMYAADFEMFGYDPI